MTTHKMLESKKNAYRAPSLCSTQLSLKLVLLINLKFHTIANSLLLNITEHENFPANKYENANYCWHFHIY